MSAMSSCKSKGASQPGETSRGKHVTARATRIFPLKTDGIACYFYTGWGKQIGQVWQIGMGKAFAYDERFVVVALPCMVVNPFPVKRRAELARLLFDSCWLVDTCKGLRWQWMA